ncbi:hypothetical protein [uncultured Massilia sp.]|uniref:hypothetical protein n=1 Tax=uncultured Massilia sp. TaxID=169973 RepID=UPI0025ED4D52|nr:hypothetical protein [uncultured Massilia sp.]
MPLFSLTGVGQRLRLRPWTDVLRAAWLLLLAGICLKMLLPASASALRSLVPVAPLLPLMAKDLAHLPDALARSRALAAARRWHALPAAWLPPELVGLLRLGQAQRQGVFHWLRRRPHAALPVGQAFTYLERGSYRTAVAIAVFCALVELPLDAAIVAVLPVADDKRQLLHVLMLAGGVSALAWVLGDRWHVGAGCHVLNADGLALRVGARAEGTIPLAAIGACRHLDERVAAWCRKHGIDVRRTVTVSPFDRPNVVLLLDPAHRASLRHLGRERDGLACVFLYVDRPATLLQALS